MKNIKIKILVVIASVLFLSSFLSCFKRPDLIILYNGDVRGEWKACRCSKKPQGGIARRAFLIKTLRDEAGSNNTIILDSGNLFSQAPFRTPPSLEKINLSSSIFGEVYKSIGVEAIGVGPFDIMNLGIDGLINLQNKYLIPFISANLAYTSGELVFPPTISITSAKRNIEVIGITAPDISPPGNNVYQSYLRENDLVVQDPIEILSSIIEKARKKADLIILLSNWGLNKDGKILKSVSGIDIIIGGGGYKPLQEPIEVENSLIFREGVRGRYLGLIKFNSAGKFDHQLIPLIKDINLDPETLKVVEKFKNAK